MGIGLSDARADAPRRVVSMNLCTDQLAMMLADEGQLLSVSRIALDAHVSAMAERARAFRINRGQAEDIYLMQPDLVLAGEYTPSSTVEMLRGLGIRVEIFTITSSLDEVTQQLAKMGRVLHRDAQAAAMIREFNARRAAIEGDAQTRPRAIFYHANGLTSGAGSLAHEILDLAGFTNAAIAAGYDWGRKLPLEVLALTNPDLVITSTPYPGGSRGGRRHAASRRACDSTRHRHRGRDGPRLGLRYALRAAGGGTPGAGTPPYYRRGPRDAAGPAPYACHRSAVRGVHADRTRAPRYRREHQGSDAGAATRLSHL